LHEQPHPRYRLGPKWASVKMTQSL
jgi:hypothetical protein